MTEAAAKAKEIVKELRPHAIWHVLFRLLEAFVMPTAYIVLGKIRNVSWDWWVAGGLLLVSLLVLFRDFIFRKKKPVEQMHVAMQNVPTPTANLDARQFFKTAYYSQLTADVETNIRAAAAQNQPNDREGFLAKFIGVGYMAYVHDMTWAYIYKSQILMLTELNRRGGLMPIADAKSYYDKAKAECEKTYSTYPFEAWLSFVTEREQLIIRHPSDMLEITLRGRDFLKYLTHWGRSADGRVC